MTTYIYFVKCPGCEDEHFDFFDEAKEFALGCLSQKPIITQTEVCRNDFGECTDSADLGTVWSWEDMMGDSDGEYTEAEPATSVFIKDDLKPWIEDEDSEFDNLDNSVDCEEPVLEEARVDPIDSVEATDRKLISLVQDNIKGPLADKAGSSGFYSENGQRFMAIPVSTNSDAYDFDSYKKELQQVFPNTDIYCIVDDSEIVIDVTSFYTERKPIPEGMTIEQLVEEMEENEDTVECTWCNDLFDKSECRYEVDLGWLCSRCEMAIKSRGETLTFKENNYWDFLDEDLETKTWICEFDGKEIGTVEASTEEEAYAAMEREYPEYHYGLYDGVAIVYPADEDELDENVKEIHDLGNDYDGGYPDETPEVSDSHLRLCPECGKETFDTETGICVTCGFN